MDEHERAEAEDIVRAIRHGEVDAFVVREADEDRIYSLRSADVLYRAMIEEMKDGAVALDGIRPDRLLQRLLRPAGEGGAAARWSGRRSSRSFRRRDGDGFFECAAASTARNGASARDRAARDRRRRWCRCWRR